MSQKKLKEAYEALEELTKLFDDRIVENNTVGKHMMSKQATHAYILYRRLAWKAEFIIRDLIK